MGGTRRSLLRDFRALERRLRQDWARDLPPLSAELRRYRADWLATLSGPTRTATEAELTAALGTGDPVLVGDFHALRRASLHLGGLVEAMPAGKPAGLLLELLPRAVTVKAAEALRNRELRLVDGRTLAEVYGPSLRRLARQGGLVAGAWVDGTPALRDHAAAERWRELQVEQPARRWLLFFGDWHLAEDHLPRLLRLHGARPTMLHQSPEPIWERLNGSRREAVLDLGAGHWAWLRTPPLAHWASALQELGQHDPDATAEVTEELVEALAAELAAALRLPEPSSRPSVWPTPLWTGFHATLPTAERHALAADLAPRTVIFHPSQPALWADGPPALNHLVEAAGHVLLCDSPLAGAQDLHGRLCARTFRRIWAALINPFLLPPSLGEAARRLFPDPERRPRLRNLGILLEAWGRGRTPFLSPRQRLLAVEVLGARAGGQLAQESRTDHAFARELLRSGGATLGWDDLTATIRAA